MACISTIDIQTRLDVQELLSHFSHFLDHNQGTCWAELFTVDGVFECADGSRLRGTSDLSTVPAKVYANGGGVWRHLITAVVIKRVNTRKDLVVQAYGPVIDMNQASAMAAFYDYSFTLRFGSSWRIAHALARRVGAIAAPEVGAAAIANGAMTSMALQ
jgi:hypothetical protein